MPTPWNCTSNNGTLQMINIHITQPTQSQNAQYKFSVLKFFRINKGQNSELEHKNGDGSKIQD